MAGPALFSVPSKVTVPPGRPSSSVAGLLPPAASAPGLGDGAGEAGAPAFHHQPAVDPDGLVGAGLGDAEIDVLDPSAESAGTVVVGDQAVLDPDIAQHEAGDLPRRGRLRHGLVVGCAVAERPVPPPVRGHLEMDRGRRSSSRSILTRFSLR
jgi:hypothetical protein